METFAAPSTNQNAINGTDLDQALENAFHRFKNLKAVLLLSDGDWNMGKSPLGAATRYREQNIPVFTVAVGRETPLPDLALENVSAPAYGLLGEEIAIPFKVTSHLPREVKTTVCDSGRRRRGGLKTDHHPAQRRGGGCHSLVAARGGRNDGDRQVARGTGRSHRGKQ